MLQHKYKIVDHNHNHNDTCLIGYLWLLALVFTRLLGFFRDIDRQGLDLQAIQNAIVSRLLALGYRRVYRAIQAACW